MLVGSATSLRNWNWLLGIFFFMLNFNDHLWMPVDPASNKTFGYCFLEYKDPQLAEFAKMMANGYKLDRRHILAVNMFDDIVKFLRVPVQSATPETKQYMPGFTEPNSEEQTVKLKEGGYKIIQVQVGTNITGNH